MYNNFKKPKTWKKKSIKKFNFWTKKNYSIKNQKIKDQRDSHILYDTILTHPICLSDSKSICLIWFIEKFILGKIPDFFFLFPFISHKFRTIPMSGNFLDGVQWETMDGRVRWENEQSVRDDGKNVSGREKVFHTINWHIQ